MERGRAVELEKGERREWDWRGSRQAIWLVFWLARRSEEGVR